MSYELEPDVLSEIAKYFHGEKRAEAERLLASTTLWAERSGPPSRIHIAFLDMANGDFGRFKSIVKGYSGDWRDALISVGLADEDWRQKLLARNIDPSNWK